MSDEAVKEAKAMFKTLEWTFGMIAQSGPEKRQYMADAYCEAQELIARILKENGDARSRILACFERSDAYRAVDDDACVGWILSAIQERVNEQNLPDWRKFRKIVKMAVKMLSAPKPMVH
ncbi:MAG: hypothetical protein U5N27_22695 [Rhizobium sp.]|nr:hypothetical protein [Rhizobium sp.]